MAEIIFSFRTTPSVRQANRFNQSLRRLGEAFGSLAETTTARVRVRNAFSRLARGVELGIADLTRECAIVAAGELGRRTPIDTGNAVSSWTPTVGAPLIRREALVLSRDRTALEAFARTRLAPLRLGQDAYIANGVPYIERLEAGHSQQAPSGFTAQTVTGVLRFARSRGREVFEAPLRRAVR